MNCYDCARGRVSETATGVCRHCGAGICAEHTIEDEVVVTKTVVMAREVPLPLKARKLLCTVCHQALSQPK